jgi:dCTP diphosphatase
VRELAAELQWLATDRTAELVSQEPRRTAVADELADVLLYLVRRADVLDIDLQAAAEAKLVKNAVKHPASEAARDGG